MSLKIWTATLLGLIAGGGSAWASGFYTAEFYAAQVGQALAATTLVENAGVVASNPSAMVRLEEGMHVLGGISLFDINVDYQALDASGNVSESGSSTTDVEPGPAAYGVWNMGDTAFGVGLYFPFASRAEYAPDWAGRHLLIRQEITVGYTAVSGAIKMSENTSLGIGVNFIGATALLTQSFTTLTPGEEILATLGATGETIGLSVSFLYFGENWAVGFNHNPEYDLTLDGAANFDTSSTPSLTSIFADGNVSLTIGMPAITEIGISWKDSRENPTVFVEFAVLKTGWSNFEEIRVDFESDRPVNELVAERNWRDTFDYKLGGNWVMSRGGDTDHILRAGILVGEAPGRPETLDPAVPDGEGRTDYAFGYGLKTESMRFDVSYIYADIEESRTTTDGSNEFPAIYKIDAQVLSTSLAFSF